MKKMRVDINRVGTENFVVSFDLQIKVKNESIKDSSVSILENILELGDIFKIDDIYYMSGAIVVEICSPSGNEHRFRFQIIGKSPIIDGTLDDVKSYFERIVEIAKEIEAWCIEQESINTSASWVFK